MFNTLSPNRLKPKLTSNENGDLLLTIHVGNDTLTRVLPPMETPDEAETYINQAVVDMAKELYRKRRNRNKRRSK